MVKRFIIASATVMLNPQHNFMLVAVYVTVSLISLGYVISEPPMDQRVLNHMELINDLFVM